MYLSSFGLVIFSEQNDWIRLQGNQPNVSGLQTLNGRSCTKTKTMVSFQSCCTLFKAVFHCPIIVSFAVFHVAFAAISHCSMPTADLPLAVFLRFCQGNHSAAHFGHGMGIENRFQTVPSIGIICLQIYQFLLSIPTSFLTVAWQNNKVRLLHLCR